MGYIYRFLNNEDKVIYIGKTSNLTKRINHHFSFGHLEDNCYLSCTKIEYMELPTMTDTSMAEIYFINKYKPLYNICDKYNDECNDYSIMEKWMPYDFLLNRHKLDFMIYKKDKLGNMINEINNLKELQREIQLKIENIEGFIKKEFDFNINISDINSEDFIRDKELKNFILIIDNLYELLSSDFMDMYIRYVSNDMFYIDIKGLWDTLNKDNLMTRNSFLKLCKKFNILNGTYKQYYKNINFGKGKNVKCYLFRLNDIKTLLRKFKMTR